MFSLSDFWTYTQWSAGLMVLVGALTGVAFLLGWGLRYRLVGATGFMGVLTAGLLTLSVVPVTPSVTIPDAVRYSLVYDTGATSVVIAVPPTITRHQLEATLTQAASNLYSPGRIGRSSNQLTIRARTVLHPEPGVSQPLYLGQAQRSLAVREDPNPEITIFDQNLAQLA